MNDVERVLRSPEGAARLEELRRSLLGRKVEDVTFANEVHAVEVLLHLDDGAVWPVSDPSLDVEALRLEFADALRRERLAEYPDRGTQREP